MDDNYLTKGLQRLLEHGENMDWLIDLQPMDKNFWFNSLIHGGLSKEEATEILATANIYKLSNKNDSQTSRTVPLIATASHRHTMEVDYIVKVSITR